MSNEMMVSICCLAYNHEKYIRKALDSFLMQKTNFRYEVLIHDDASTDRTPEIIREYEKKYPDIIKPIYQTENQYSKQIKISWVYQYPRIQGKYFAMCEGDDFWTDPYKLQKQFDALENHPECVVCFHKVSQVDESGEQEIGCIPTDQLESSLIVQNENVRLALNHTFQTSCFFMRSDILHPYLNNIPEFVRTARVGDVPLWLLYASKGSAYYLNESMSCYRSMSQGSWSTKHRDDKEFALMHKKRMVDCLKKYNDFTENRFIEDVEMKRLKWEFELYYHEKNYKVLRHKHYRKVLAQYSWKRRAYLLMQIYCPPLGNLIKRIFHK